MAKACWCFVKGELASWLFLDDVQGFRMAKTWCFLVEGKLASASLPPFPPGNRCLPFIGAGSSWQLWKIGFLMQEDEALVAMALIEFDWRY
ncbi:hypothetical protein GBA52_010632 [Prunus armeniaca]|nr:hypothetical protein GBA52_010632 [Prunus armeniaca]